ncbi:MAG: glycosyltransferase [Nocardioidaceae bacterium]
MTVQSPVQPGPAIERRAGNTSPTTNLTYVVPLRRTAVDADDDLTSYLRHLATLVEVVVADGSPPDVYAVNGRLWGTSVRQLPVTSFCLNGKVAGVVDGVHAATHPHVVIADDDVRYDEEALSTMARLLTEHAVVRPQNYFSPLPWHARWDSARTLLNRALGHDYPGTLGVHRAAFRSTAGYCGAVLFENLELIRTLRAHGFSVHNADDVFVRRRPPDARHFFGQRIRQAYDSRAQPLRWLAELALLPAAGWALKKQHARALSAGMAASVAAAEVGRRRHGGSTVFAATLPLWAPLWLAERALCAWLAVGAGVRGGAGFAGRRLRRAAHTQRQLCAPGCPESDCTCRTVWRHGRPLGAFPWDGSNG